MALSQDTGEEGSTFSKYEPGSQYAEVDRTLPLTNQGGSTLAPLDPSTQQMWERLQGIRPLPPVKPGQRLSGLTQLAGDVPTNYSFPNVEGASEGEGERSSFEDPYSTKNVISATVTEGPNKGADVTPQAGGTPTPKPNMQNVIDWVSGNVTPESLAAGQKTTLDAARKKVDEDEAASKQGIGAMTHRMRELESIRNATAHTIADLPPKWDADKEGRDRIRGPLESFGSFASVFAIAASAFTKQPAINALTASAAAMTAIHQSDAEGYERAYRAWKDNTELVHKRFEMERQVFQDTSTLFDKDSTLWVSKMKANAARFNDTQMQALLEAGLWGDAIKLMDSRSLAMEHMVEGAKKFEEFNTNLQYREALQKEAAQKHPDWSEQQKAMYNLLTLQETQPGTVQQKQVARLLREKFEQTGVLTAQDIKDADYIEAGKTERLVQTLSSRERLANLSAETKRELGKLSATTRQEITDKLEAGRDKRAELSAEARKEIAELTVEARREIAELFETGRETRSIRAEEGKTTRAQLSADTKKELQEASAKARTELEELRESGRDHRSEMSDSTRRELADMSRKSREDIVKWLEEGRQLRQEKDIQSKENRQKEHDAAVDARSQKILDKKEQDTAPMSDAAIDSLVKRTLAGEPTASVRRNIGYNRASNSNLNKYNDALAKAMEEEGVTPEELNKRQADWQGKIAAGRTAGGAETGALKKSLDQSVTMSHALDQYERSMLRQLDILVGLGKKVDKSGVPVIERWSRPGRKALGDPDVADFDLQWKLVTTEAARAIANPRLVGVLTDTAQREMQEALPKSANVKQLERVSARLHADADIRREEIGAEIETIKTQIKEGHVKPFTAAPKEEKYEEYKTLPNGQKIGRKGDDWYKIK